MTLEGVHGLTPVVRHRKAVAGLAILFINSNQRLKPHMPQSNRKVCGRRWIYPCFIGTAGKLPSLN
jgi:hypothetical protein